ACCGHQWQFNKRITDVLKIPGLGPKTVKAIWDHAGVTDIPSLKEAIASGTLADVPRMGAKTIQNITDSIAFAEKSSDRTRLGQAQPLAEQIVASLQQRKDVKAIDYAGSLRRGRETIGDIDILVAATKADAISDAFQTMPGVEKVLVAGDTKSSIRLDVGVQVDLRIVPPDVYGAALMYFTGSKEHNVVMRERAIKRGLRLNEYGLFPEDDEDSPPQTRGIKPVAAKTEQDIYAALELPYIPPELREARGEFDTDPPALITVKDIKAELHAHTIASDGKMTIEELAECALERGFHTIAVTDHSRSSAQANGLEVDRLLEHIDAVHAVNEAMDDITVLAGSEVDILADGRLDYNDDILAQLDVVVASPHTALSQDPKKATARLLKAIEHPLVHIIGHPTGRIINKREGLLPDVPTLIAAAVEHDTAMEINSNFLRLDLRDTHVRAVVEAGGLIAIDTDAHTPQHFEFLRYGVTTARRGWLTKQQCINAWSKTKLYRWLKSKR
ncbi:MAG: DNA polymerase/3'-5' exonuclease PolX, partial [Planctomycetota bacterium]